ncbi:MAG: hypothetical protein ACYC9O_05960, partial [Candidatus Latescibacterota bacterium]
MVRQTALLKSRRERKLDPVPVPEGEPVYDHGSRKSRSLFLESGDLNSLLDSITRKKSESAGPAADKPDPPEPSPAVIPAASGAEPAFSLSGNEAAEVYTPDFRRHAGQFAGDADALARYRADSAHADAVYIGTLDLLEEVYRRKYANR